MLHTHHSKIETFLIHLVAVLFLLSTISAAFLGYGIYQNDISSAGHLPTTIPSVQAATGGDSFSQTSWAGGASSDIYTIPWFSSKSWNKYSDASNVIPDEMNLWAMKATAAGAWLTSSVFEVGTQYLVGCVGGSYEGTLTFRGASNSGGPWTSWKSRFEMINYRYIQYKITFSAAGQGMDIIDFSTPSASVGGVVKDASTSNGISGVTVKVNGRSTNTVLHKNRLIPIAHAGGSGQPPPTGSFYTTWEHKVGDPSSYQVTASKSGYTTQTKTASMVQDGCSFTGGVTISLSKPTSSGSSSDTSSSTDFTSSEPSVATATFQSTNLPSIFTKKGSKTTNLSTVKDPKKVKNFTLDVKGKNKIIFKETLNLSGESTVEALKKLDKYVKMDKPGVIELDSKTLKAMNKAATLTMYGIKKHVFTPEIIVDGEKAGQGLITNEKYDKPNSTLTFDVAHFTKFEATPRIEILSPTGETVTEQITVIRGRISDPNAVIAGDFNGVNLAAIEIDEKTGEFILERLTFKQGENVLTLKVTSELGEVLPLQYKFEYLPNGAVPAAATTDDTLKIAIMGTLAVAIGFAAVLGYLLYRKRKRHEHHKAVAAGV